ncbi:hypothetical protein Rleg5DRAFT_3269 [Rhizobium leguminosarum bv. viciae WSM1455]|nr:hypothetical protein Rleg5DRAFT_3269 [Rhizobium leguminosarum bv. viciae WSM1455]
MVSCSRARRESLGRVSEKNSGVSGTAEYTRLSAYFDEMGVNAETYEAMMPATSTERGRIIVPSQALELGIINGIIPYDEEPGLHVCGPEAKESLRCPRKAEAEIVPVAASFN